MKKAVFPGTFDPITFGHIDIIQRGLKLFDRLVIAVSEGTEKSPLFTLEERVQLIKRVFARHPRVTVRPFEGLLIDFVASQNVQAIIRGLRWASEFDYEMQMACMNYSMRPEIETVFLPPTQEHLYTASSLVRVIARNRGDLSPFVPKLIQQALEKKIYRLKG